MLSVNNLDIRFGEKHLFKNISTQVYPGNRIGLVGVNGAGKSTLLKIMVGDFGCDDGVVHCSKHFSIGYLAQESSDLTGDHSLYQEAERAFGPLLAMQEELQQILAKIDTIAPDSEAFNTLIERQGEIQYLLEGSELYAIEGKIEKVLLGLGFKKEEMQKEVSAFSGGWQMRLKLAKMLLEAPSLLLLDEPTNHLDLESLTWVEQFLRNYQGAMIIISHDRTFLDKVTDTTWELSFGKLDVYNGNYSYYVRKKKRGRRLKKAPMRISRQRFVKPCALSTGFVPKLQKPGKFRAG